MPPACSGGRYSRHDFLLAEPIELRNVGRFVVHVLEVIGGIDAQIAGEVAQLRGEPRVEPAIGQSSASAQASVTSPK